MFSEDLTAVQISNLSGSNRNSVNRLLRLIRERIYELTRLQSPFKGEVEVDESFFGARRIKGKRGRGAYGKTIVFGVYRGNGKVYTEVVKNCSRATLQAIIKGKVDLDSIIHSDKWRGYKHLVDLGYKKHYRLDHGKGCERRLPYKRHRGLWGIGKDKVGTVQGHRQKNIFVAFEGTEFR